MPTPLCYHPPGHIYAGSSVGLWYMHSYFKNKKIRSQNLNFVELK